MHELTLSGPGVYEPRKVRTWDTRLPTEEDDAAGLDSLQAVMNLRVRACVSDRPSPSPFHRHSSPRVRASSAPL